MVVSDLKILLIVWNFSNQILSLGYPAPGGYGFNAPGSIPDPYAQPPAYGYGAPGGFGVPPPNPGFGGGYY